MTSRVSAWCAALKSNDGKPMADVMRRPALAAGCGQRQAVRLCVAVLALLLAGSAFPQADHASGSGTASEAEQETSKQVDESEESYRTRMELRDQRFREQKRADTTYSSQGGTSKMDQLPEASREHVKEQLRDMIIASRQWKPGEDVSDYPYEPSEAAQTDAQLLRQEREAWAEQLQKYQQREAAAYATANAASPTQDGGQQGGQGAAGSGQQDAANGASSRPGSAGQGQSSSARSAQSYQGRERDAEQVSTAGVSESALSFLQGKAGQAAQPAMQGAAASQADSPEPGGAAAQTVAATTPAGQQQGSAGQSSGKTPDAESDNATPEGTVAIDDLSKMDNGMSQSAAVSANRAEAAETGQASALAPAEPGTLEIEELRKLGGS
jgi:hypothetical protein